ncbi:MAG: PDZ domain-containing protein gipc3 [Paramarteilia canceri]
MKVLVLDAETRAGHELDIHMDDFEQRNVLLTKIAELFCLEETDIIFLTKNHFQANDLYCILDDELFESDVIYVHRASSETKTLEVKKDSGPIRFKVVESKSNGQIISQIQNDCIFTRQGFQDVVGIGDVIHSINDKPMQSSDDLSKCLTETGNSSIAKTTLLSSTGSIKQTILSWKLNACDLNLIDDNFFPPKDDLTTMMGVSIIMPILKDYYGYESMSLALIIWRSLSTADFNENEIDSLPELKHLKLPKEIINQIKVSLQRLS